MYKTWRKVALRRIHVTDVGGRLSDVVYPAMLADENDPSPGVELATFSRELEPELLTLIWGVHDGLNSPSSRSPRKRPHPNDLSARRPVGLWTQRPTATNREGDMLQDPKSGNWIKVVRTADGTTSVTHRYSDGERMVIEQYRVYYGDGGVEIDSRFVKGLVNRQVRE